MPTRKENILHILGEAEEALLATEIAEHLNSELRPDSAYSTVEVAKCMKSIFTNGNAVMGPPSQEYR